MIITDEQIKILADYAKLDIEKNELKKLQKDLSQVVESFEIIKEVDTSDLEPMIDINQLKNVFRQDIVENDNMEDNQVFALKNAPNKKDGFVVVPKILE